MKRYSVSMRAVVTREVEIEAETPEEAVGLVRDRCATGDAIPNPTVDVRSDGRTVVRHQPVALQPESVSALVTDEDGDTVEEDAWSLMGVCEVCLVPILDGRDEGASYGEDVDLCAKCATECIEEAGADETSALGGEK